MSRKQRAKRDRQKSSRKTPITISYYLEHAPFRMALGINVLLFLLTYACLTPRFLWNDDPMMMLLAAGVGRVAEPTSYLTFTHILIGWVLKNLYSLAIDVP